MNGKEHLTSGPEPLLTLPFFILNAIEFFFFL